MTTLQLLEGDTAQRARRRMRLAVLVLGVLFAAVSIVMTAPEAQAVDKPPSYAVSKVSGWRLASGSNDEYCRTRVYLWRQNGRVYSQQLGSCFKNKDLSKPISEAQINLYMLLRRTGTPILSKGRVCNFAAKCRNGNLSKSNPSGGQRFCVNGDGIYNYDAGPPRNSVELCRTW